MWIVASGAVVTKQGPAMPAPILIRVAFKTKGWNIIGEVVLEFRTVGGVAVATALLGRKVIVPGIKYPLVAVQTDKGRSWIRGVGIMASLASGIANRCVLVPCLDDIHMARSTGR